MIPTDTELIKL